MQKESRFSKDYEHLNLPPHCKRDMNPPKGCGYGACPISIKVPEDCNDRQIDACARLLSQALMRPTKEERIITSFQRDIDFEESE